MAFDNFVSQKVKQSQDLKRSNSPQSLTTPVANFKGPRIYIKRHKTAGNIQ